MILLQLLHLVDRQLLSNITLPFLKVSKIRSLLPSPFISSLGITSVFVWLLLCPLFLLAAGCSSVSSSFLTWTGFTFWAVKSQASFEPSAQKKTTEKNTLNSFSIFFSQIISSTDYLIKYFLKKLESVKWRKSKQRAWQMLSTISNSTADLKWNSTVAKWSIWHNTKHTHTWFNCLGANLPLVLGHRINLDHLLQVDFVGHPRAQRQSDGGFSWRDGWVQQGAVWRWVWFPLSFISFPLPHWSHIEKIQLDTLLQMHQLKYYKLALLYILVYPDSSFTRSMECN